MRLTTTARDLAAVLRAGAPLASSGHASVLSRALLSADKGGASLRFCDLDAELVLTLPAAVGAPGALLVPVPPLARLLASTPGNTDLTLSLDDGGLRVEASFGRYLFPGMPASAAPVFLAGNGPSFSLGFDDEEAVRRVLGVARRCVSAEETRFYLCGVALDFDGPRPVAVATDGHVLASAPLPVTTEGPTRNVIVPAGAVRMLGRLRLDRAPVQVFSERAVMEARVAGGVYRTKLIDGTFPDWRRVMPEGGAGVVVRFGAGDVLPILARLAAVPGDARGVTIAVGPDSRAVLYRPSDGGSGCEYLRVEVVRHAGPPAAVVFNPSLLRRLLTGVEPEVTVSIYDDRSAMRVDAGDVHQLLMPMRGQTAAALAALHAGVDEATA